MDMPLTPHQLDALARAVSEHTKLSRRAFKKAVATAFGFNTVDSYEHHLDKKQHFWPLERTVLRYMVEIDGMLSHFGIDPDQIVDNKIAYQTAIDETTSLAHYLVEKAEDIMPLTFLSLDSFKQAVIQCDTTYLPSSLCDQLPANEHPGEGVYHDSFPEFSNYYTRGPVPRQPLIALRTSLSSQDISWLWALQDAAFSGTDRALQKIVSWYLLSLCEQADEIAAMIGMPLTDIAVSLYYTQRQNCFIYNPKSVLFGNAFTVHIPTFDTTTILAPWRPAVSAEKILCWHNKESLHVSCQRLSATTQISTLHWKYVLAKVNGFNKVESFLSTLSVVTFLSHAKHAALFGNTRLTQRRKMYLSKMATPMTTSDKERQDRLCKALVLFSQHDNIISIAANDILEHHTPNSQRPPEDSIFHNDDSMMDLINNAVKDDIAALQKMCESIRESIRTSTTSENPCTMEHLKSADPHTLFFPNVQLTRNVSETLAYLNSEKGRRQYPLSPSAWQHIYDCIKVTASTISTYTGELASVSAGEIISFIESNTSDAPDKQAERLLSRLVATPSKRALVPRRVRQNGPVKHLCRGDQEQSF